MKFVQIIEFRTKRPDEVQAAVDEYLASTEGKRSAGRGMTTKDRDQSDVYCQIIEFPSYEAAMKNSALAETGDFAKRMDALCDGPTTFRNLDVIEEQAM